MACQTTKVWANIAHHNQKESISIDRNTLLFLLILVCLVLVKVIDCVWLGVQCYTIIFRVVAKLFNVLGNVESIPRLLCWWVCHKHHVFLGNWVVKLQAVSLKCKVVTTAHHISAVAHVAPNWAVDCGKLNTDLVRATCAKLNLDQRRVLCLLQHFVR